MEATMDLLLIFLLIILFIGWVAVIHLLFCVLFDGRLICDYKCTRSVIIVMELVIDFFFAMFYFELIFPIISNPIIYLFKN